MAKEIKTLQEAVIHFADPENCREFMVALRWPDGKVKCPICGSTNVDWLPNAKLFKCYAKPAHKRQKFSLKVGTIFEDSPIGLEKWLPVMWMLANCKNGISSWEIHRAVGVTQKSAWFMLQRGRLAMQDDFSGGTLNGEIEVDESFIGGKVRNMHKDRKARAQKHSQKGDKTVVLGILERASEGKPKCIRTSVIADRKKDSILPEVKAHVAKGSVINSDEHGQYWQSEDYEHRIVNHLEHYVQGNVHTNSLENFWSLLKRSIGGSYGSVEPFHLFRYVDEQAFRFNNRKMTDGERFTEAMRQIVGRRLTFAEVTGKVGGPETSEGQTEART